MNRFSRFLSLCFLAAAVLAGLTLVPACSISPTASSGATGFVNVLVTDAATDDWQEVTVVLKSVGLRNKDDFSWTKVWEGDPADPDSGKVNLLDLSGVADILAKATVPVGSYDRARMVIDTNPASITIVDTNGMTVPTANIVVVDPSKRGEIRVDLTPPITVEEGVTTNLLVDFDLAHPLSIVDLAGKIVVNLQLRHRPLPARIHHLQFARKIGIVTAVTSSSFTMKTLRGNELTYGVNEATQYIDADLKQPGSLAGLTVDKAVLVASNMNSDGSLFARRVWYAADVKTLPRFTPEGLVMRVGPDWITVLRKANDATTDHCWAWRPVTVAVDEATVWTFKRDVPMGTGTSVLQHIRRGFRVHVELVNPDVTPKVAAAINVHCAHDEGFITETTETDFTFGWWRDFSRTLPYSVIPEHPFTWWYFALPSETSTSIEDFRAVVNEARAANLCVFAWSGLYWDEADGRWVAEKLVLAPQKLHEPTKVVTAYTTGSGSMGVSTFNWQYPDQPQLMTVFLDATGNLQTLVASYKWNSTTRVFSITVPVVPTEWEALLTPELDRVKVWVRPVKGDDGSFTWRAYTVIAFQHSD